MLHRYSCPIWAPARGISPGPTRHQPSPQTIIDHRCAWCSHSSINLQMYVQAGMHAWRPDNLLASGPATGAGLAALAAHL